MRVGFMSRHWNDSNNNPEGGVSTGTGFTISWQHGPLGNGENRVEANGAFVEDVISACIDRIKYYQDSRFNCSSNAKAIEHLNIALEALDSRTKDREVRGVEGTHNE